MLAVALGDVEAAMIGGQHHDIVDAGRIELAEEGAELVVESEQLDAHLAALGAVGMADIIGGRETEDEQVGTAALAEPHLAAQAGADLERRAVEIGRRAE